MIRAALLLLGLTLAGVDIPPPSTGVVVGLERVAGHVTRRHARCDGFQTCPGVVVDIKRSRYLVHYEWVRGWAGRSSCEVSPSTFHQSKRGQAFRCES